MNPANFPFSEWPEEVTYVAGAKNDASLIEIVSDHLLHPPAPQNRQQQPEPHHPRNKKAYQANDGYLMPFRRNVWKNDERGTDH